MNINIELETYKALTAMMYLGAETYDDVIQDLMKRAKMPIGNFDEVVNGGEPKSSFAYQYERQWYSCDSGKDLLVSALRMICRDNPEFLKAYAEEVNSEGRTRAYVARSREELYPDNSKLQMSAVEILSDGWLLGTNMSNTRKTRMLKSACKVLGLRYGVDLVVKMG